MVLQNNKINRIRKKILKNVTDTEKLISCLNKNNTKNTISIRHVQNKMNHQFYKSLYTKNYCSYISSIHHVCCCSCDHASRASGRYIFFWFLCSLLLFRRTQHRCLFTYRYSHSLNKLDSHKERQQRMEKEDNEINFTSFTLQKIFLTSFLFFFFNITR